MAGRGLLPVVISLPLLVRANSALKAELMGKADVGPGIRARSVLKAIQLAFKSGIIKIFKWCCFGEMFHWYSFTLGEFLGESKDQNEEPPVKGALVFLGPPYQ